MPGGKLRELFFGAIFIKDFSPDRRRRACFFYNNWKALTKMYQNTLHVAQMSVFLCKMLSEGRKPVVYKGFFFMRFFLRQAVQTCNAHPYTHNGYFRLRPHWKVCFVHVKGEEWRCGFLSDFLIDTNWKVETANRCSCESFSNSSSAKSAKMSVANIWRFVNDTKYKKAFSLADVGRLYSGAFPKQSQSSNIKNRLIKPTYHEQKKFKC